MPIPPEEPNPIVAQHLEMLQDYLDDHQDGGDGAELEVPGDVHPEQGHNDPEPHPRRVLDHDEMLDDDRDERPVDVDLVIDPAADDEISEDDNDDVIDPEHQADDDEISEEDDVGPEENNLDPGILKYFFFNKTCKNRTFFPLDNQL